MGRTVIVQPNAKTGAHHHGELESVLYVIRGRARMRWGDHLEFVDEAGPGDFIYVPPYVPHQEMNASSSEPVEVVVVRSGQEPIVVNLDIPSPDQTDEAAETGHPVSPRLEIRLPDSDERMTPPWRSSPTADAQRFTDLRGGHRPRRIVRACWFPSSMAHASKGVSQDPSPVAAGPAQSPDKPSLSRMIPCASAQSVWGIPPRHKKSH